MKAYSWKSIRAERVAKGLIDEERLSEIGKQMREETRGYRLREMREQYDDMSHATVAVRIGEAESVIEQIELGDIENMPLATIRNYGRPLAERSRCSPSLGMNAL
jgi:hypothetical protein